MDNSLERGLVAAAWRLGVEVGPEALEAFSVYLEELRRFGKALNLTAVRDPAQIIEKHFVDSIALVPWVCGQSLLDVGTGAGFPGMVVKIVRPAVRVTLVDAAGKKISFLKALMARLGTEGAEARAIRVEGRPEREGLGRYATVVSRAVEAPEEWLPRAKAYVEPGGRVIAMLGRSPGDGRLRAAGERAGLALEGVVPYRLEPSGAERALALYRAP